ncbi:phosphotransferase [Streptomyces enissocaesilis]|uniref:Aminoglycoside phosphotransferase domain-containing protein n=1 Tax=Streptomyces enissocaesilis TaxID=332589 RepID=A0ABN3X6A2_9ACTN
MSRPVLTDHAVRHLLTRHARHGIDVRRAHVVADLTPGLSSAAIVRVDLGGETAWGRTVVLKAYGPATGADDFRQDTPEALREAAVYRTGIVEQLTARITTPALRAADTSEDGVHLWLEDVADHLTTVWTTETAAQAITAISQLHTARHPALETELPEETEEFDAFRHHVPAALALVAADQDTRSAGTPVLTAADARLGILLLGRAADFAKELRDAPAVFQHGDFHIDNAGRLPDGRFLLIDWAQAGRAPVGADIAVFLSNYRARGGHSGTLTQHGFDAEMTDVYCEGLRAGGADEALVRTARRVIDLWAVSWAVQVRLGPGLAAASDPRLPEGTREGIARDIREGLARARTAAERLRIAVDDIPADGTAVDAAAANSELSTDPGTSAGGHESED